MSRKLIAGLALGAVLAAPLASARSFVFPHVSEQKGRIASSPFTFDTTIYAVYTGGLPNWDPTAVPRGNCCRGHVTILKLYLQNDDGSAMTSQTGQAVCAPCTLELSPTERKRSFVLEDLIEAAGGFPRSPGGVDAPMTGYAVLEVPDGDAEAVAVQGFVVNSHSNPLDLSVFGFEPQPIAAAN